MNENSEAAKDERKLPFRLLFLTNTSLSAPLVRWLEDRVELRKSGAVITEGDVRSVDLAVSYGYEHIIRPEVIRAGRFVNLHIAYLPYNRGADPNAWAHLEGTPSGVTIHQIDAGIDTGPILARRRVFFDEHETLHTSYLKLQAEIQALFRLTWKGIRDGTLAPIPQQGAGTHHYAREFESYRKQLLGNEGWQVKISTFKERWKHLSAMRAK